MKWGQGGGWGECVFFLNSYNILMIYFFVIHLRQVTSNSGEKGPMVVGFQG